MLRTWHIRPGTRVASMAGTDDYARGDFRGTVTKVGRKWLYVEMESGRRRRFLIEGNEGFDPRVPSLRGLGD